VDSEKTHKLPDGRRTSERRVADMAFAAPDKRVAERRSHRDRRADPRD
jgi:hypothetical protein